MLRIREYRRVESLEGSLRTQSEENEPYHRWRTLDENRRSESYDCHRFKRSWIRSDQ